MTQVSPQDAVQASTDNAADDDWNIFNFLPFNEDHLAESDNNNPSEQDIVDRFFTELPLKLAGMGLTDKRSDIIINFFIEAIKKVNQLNEILINDLNGLAPSKVCHFRFPYTMIKGRYLC